MASCTVDLENCCTIASNRNLWPRRTLLSWTLINNTLQHAEKTHDWVRGKKGNRNVQLSDKKQPCLQLIICGILVFLQTARFLQKQHPLRICLRNALSHLYFRRTVIEKEGNLRSAMRSEGRQGEQNKVSLGSETD